MKRTKLVPAFVAVVLSFVLAAVAFAGTFTLHPSGFGEHSYSAWKGQEGERDSSGNKNQALYFQKMTLTAVPAAGVAVFKGFEGMPTSELDALAFDWREDGHCGAGAPRFNLRIQPEGTTDPMLRQTIFIGCRAMTPSNGAEPGWERRTASGPFPDGTIVSLAIVFDEGNDVGQGYVYLDNIQVGDHVWTSATDNGNGSAIGPDGMSTTPLSSLISEPLSVVFARP